MGTLHTIIHCRPSPVTWVSPKNARNTRGHSTHPRNNRGRSGPDAGRGARDTESGVVKLGTHLHRPPCQFGKAGFREIARFSRDFSLPFISAFRWQLSLNGTDVERERAFWHTLCSLGRTNRVSCQADAAWIVRAAIATAGGDCPRKLRNTPRAFWAQAISACRGTKPNELMPTWAENSASPPGSPLLIRTSEWLSNRSTNQSTHSILQIRFGGC